MRLCDCAASSHERAAIFSPHLSNQRASGGGAAAGVAGTGGGGTWVGGRSTQTKQSSTLFVTNLDPSVSLEQVAALFEKEPGFFAFRTVRRMCFVDFHSVANANLAMRKRQNHSFAGCDRRLLIDYDKDPTEKRDRQFAAQVGRELEGSDNAELIELVCSACGAFCIKLRIPPPRTFLTLPRRPIDSSVAVETGKYVVELQLAKGEERAIRREGGVELQYRLVCKACKVPVAYSSTPSDPAAAPIKHLFLMAGSLRGERKEIRAGKVVHTEKDMRMQPLPKITATPGADAAASSSSAPASAASSSAASAAAGASSTAASSAPAAAAPVSSSPAVSSPSVGSNAIAAVSSSDAAAASNDPPLLADSLAAAAASSSIATSASSLALPAFSSDSATTVDVPVPSTLATPAAAAVSPPPVLLSAAAHAPTDAT